MAERLRAKTRGFAYPADAASQRLVREAGGLSKLTPAQRDRIRYKAVAIGGFCDDMPPDAAARYLERGDIERVTVDEPPAPAGRRRREAIGE